MTVWPSQPSYGHAPTLAPQTLIFFCFSFPSPYAIHTPQLSLNIPSSESHASSPSYANLPTLPPSLPNLHRCAPHFSLSFAYPLQIRSSPRPVKPCTRLPSPLPSSLEYSSSSNTSPIITFPIFPLFLSLVHQLAPHIMQNLRRKSRVPTHSKKRKVIGTFFSSSPTMTSRYQFLKFNHPPH